jgi:hypothetical protein
MDTKFGQGEIALQAIKLELKLQAMKEALGDLTSKLHHFCELVTKYA